MHAREHTLVLGKLRQQCVRSMAGAQFMQGSQGTAVLLHLIRAEELGTERRRVTVSRRRAVLRIAQVEQSFEDYLAAILQIRASQKRKVAANM